MTEPSHITTGNLGEGIAVRYLKMHGFAIVGRNYRKKWGEIDIIAQKDNVLHFVEVKTAGCNELPTSCGRDAYRPEDHMHAKKRARMVRALQSYVLEHKVTGPYTADLVIVYVSKTHKKAHVSMLFDIELPH